jgi:hypothetical protein
VSAQRIQKLEALLARITTRAAEPRPVHAVMAAAPAAHHAPAAPAPVAAPRVATPPPMRAVTQSAPEIETGEEYIDTVDVEVSTEVVEVDIDEGEAEALAAAAAADAEAGVGEEAPISSKRRPQIAPTGEVAKIEGEAPAAEASTFGDLLDDSLSI